MEPQREQVNLLVGFTKISLRKDKVFSLCLQHFDVEVVVVVPLGLVVVLVDDWLPLSKHTLRNLSG
jgi:hypothetical protein